MKSLLLNAITQVTRSTSCYTLFMLLLSSSCSKNDNRNEQFVEFEVLEYLTNAPLSGVKIDLYSCLKYDVQFGCQQKQVHSTTWTDEKGKARVTNEAYHKSNQGIVLSKTGYFTSTGSQGTTYMNKEAAVSVLLKPKQRYPSHYKLCIFTKNDRYEFEALPAIPVPSAELNTNIKIIDGQPSTLVWQVQEVYGFGGAAIKANGSINISLPIPATLTIEF